jgi:hypothetical protein
MSLHRFFLVLAALLLGAVSAHADVFKYYDSNGNLVLTDTLPKGKDEASKVEKVETRPVMTIPAIGGGSKVGGEGAVAAKQLKVYVITIKSPSPDATYQRNGGELIPVSVAVNPVLAPGHRLEVLLDGKVGDSGVSTLRASELDRGSHVLLARVVDNDNKVLSSNSIAFQVQQPGLLGPAASKPQPKPTPIPKPTPH